MTKKKKLTEAEWTAAFVNDLPDAAFAIILPGGEQDADNKTTPRSLRKLPYKNADGAVDVPHLRNALARISQVEGASAEALADARAKLEAAAEEYLQGDREEETAPEVTPPPNPPVVPAEDDAVATAIDLLTRALEALSGLQPEDGEPEDDAPPAPEDMPVESAEVFKEVAALQLVETDTPAANRRAPLRLDVGIIRVGPGNAVDNHYYTEEMLARDGGVFKGVKMYATDHRNDEKSVRTEVSLLEEVAGVREFADGKYLVGRAIVFNPDFAEDVRNRADAGVLDSLHCSILARGEVKPGKVGEQEFNIVQGITEASSVDWVTRAGAGGHALQLTENDPPAPAAPEESETETETITETLSEDVSTEKGVIQPLPVASVLTELGQTNLPAASVVALASGVYVSVTEVQAAVTAEVGRLKAAGSGQPFGITEPPVKAQQSLSEIQAALQAVNHKWLGGSHNG